MKQRIVGVLVVYDPDEALIAVSRFTEIISLLSEVNSTIIVCNNSSLNIGDIKGTNINAEFSGWDEGIEKIDLDSSDIVIFANDTFCTRLDFFDNEFNKLKNLLISCQYKKSYIAGEISWHIDYSALWNFKKFLLKWIRTSFFIVTPYALKKINTIGLPDYDKKNYIEMIDSKLHYHTCIPEIFQNRINAWLTPNSNNVGWYRLREVDITHVLLKAKCVLQELYLVKRCENEGIEIIDWNTDLSIKKYILAILYRMQLMAFTNDNKYNHI